MPGKLYPVVLPQPGESPASFVARLARRSFAASARQFCLDMGFAFQRVVDGCPVALGRIADLVGMPPAPLMHGAIRREADIYTMRGQRLVRPMLRRASLRVCPACLREDIASSPLDPACAAYGRAPWLLVPLRTCPAHARGLVEIAYARSPHEVHDFTLLAGPRLEELNNFLEMSPHRGPSPLEAYLLDRLEGMSGQAPWLDGLEFHAAAKTCEMIGAVALFGRTANLKRLSEDDWQRAGGAGFRIACGGETMVREFLSDLQRRYPYSRCARERPQAVFGRLYQWLSFGARHPAYDPVRAVVGRHILETTPVGPGDQVFGQPVERRILHSIWTASKETGAHPKRLRKLLAATGLIPKDHTLPDHRTLFSADDAVKVFRLATGALTLREVANRLNAGRVHTKLLEEHGFIRPAVPAGMNGLGRRVYSPADLNDFLERLLADAVPVDDVRDPLCDLPGAAKRANCSAMEIVQLILERRLTWTGRRTDTAGYLAVLVDVEEVKRHVRGPALDGLTARAVEKALSTTSRVIKALVAAGHLPTHRFINPLNRCPVDVIRFQDVEEFHRQYVSLIVLARERRVHHVALRKSLEAAGVQPALSQEEFHASFYRRSDLPT